MKFESEIHHRQSIRLKEYDYTKEGAYFITICTNNKQNIFGSIENIGTASCVSLNNFGEIVKQEWLKTQTIRRNIYLDEFIIMPNHIHGIIFIMNSTCTTQGRPTGSPLQAQSIGSIIGQYKSVVTKKISLAGLSDFKWQRNYYEHIIRKDGELEKVREYILNNPIEWANNYRRRGDPDGLPYGVSPNRAR